ncbi:Type-2 ice-structuring protein [Liparis tanakae]|uniref:Type-2 ice-structuring protein n=1 Tax=Liparis tanakae TaxID=230148 RepID=A0A4Z2EU04_9TELE|nr:Type-2 ice-structuring protein [Liparis tanakae]
MFYTLKPSVSGPVDLQRGQRSEVMKMKTKARLLPLLLLGAWCSSLSASGEADGAWPPCPPPWLLVGRRCFALQPVWSSWSNAEVGGHLASLHTAEEEAFVRQLDVTHPQVWLGGGQQKNGSWFWSDGSPFSGWTNQRPAEAREGGACMALTPKSIVRGVSLCDVMWGHSASLAEEILRSSSLLRQLRSGNLPRRCYDSFLQQEALYLHRVSSTLQVLIGRSREAADVTSLLQDTLKQYSRNPEWLRSSLQSFHQVALEAPVYWLVALSARAALRLFLSRELVSGSEVTAGPLLGEWSADAQAEVTWMQRFRRLVEVRQRHMDVFQAVNVFRDHMTTQRSLHKAVTCDEEGAV